MADDNNKYYEVVNELNNINESVNEDAEYNNMYSQKLVEYGARHIQDLSPLRKSTFMQEINEWAQKKQECKVKKAKRFGDDLKLTADADRRKNKNVKNAKNALKEGEEVNESGKYMSKETFVKEYILPYVKPTDKPYNRQLWNDTLDSLMRDGIVPPSAANVWSKTPAKYFGEVEYNNRIKKDRNRRDESVEQNASIQENINRQKEIIEQLLNESPKPEFDTYEADADDVILIIDNEKKFYNRKLDAFKSLTTKMNRDVYDKELAPRMFTSLAKDAAKEWYDATVKWADDGKSIVKKVTKEVIDKVCSELAKEFEYAYKNKEYDFMEDTKKKKKVDESSENIGKDFLELIHSEWLDDKAESHIDGWKDRYANYRRKEQLSTDLYVNHDPSLEVEDAEEELGRKLESREYDMLVDKFNKKVLSKWSTSIKNLRNY